MWKDSSHTLRGVENVGFRLLGVIFYWCTLPFFTQLKEMIRALVNEERGTCRKHLQCFFIGLYKCVKKILKKNEKDFVDVSTE